MNSNEESLIRESASRIDTYLKRIVPFGFAGSALIAIGEDLILNKGYGLANQAKGIPNTADSVHCLGSVTKQFTAAAVMKLAMQNKLHPHDPISKYLPGVPDDKTGITLHHLLTHTAGVINYTGEDYEVADREEMVEKVMSSPLDFSPGNQYKYSNAGYSLLAAVVEIVGKQPFETFLHEELFQPAGMESTGYVLPDWDVENVARWYVGNQDNGNALEKPYPYWNIMGNGEMLSTTADMHRWHQALQGDTILSAEMRRLLYTPFLSNYAYGWERLETEHGTLIQHDGASELGSSASYRRFVDEDVVIILFFNQSIDGTPMCRLVEDKVAALVFGDEIAIPPETISYDPESLMKIPGSYKLESGGELNVTIEDEMLKISPIGQDAINLIAFPDKPVSAQTDLNEQTKMLFEAAVSDDYGPFAKALGGDEKRAERYRLSINNAIEEKGIGEIQQVLIKGTKHSFLPDAVATEAQLWEAKDHVAFDLHWRDNQLLGLSPTVNQLPFSMILRPISQTQYVGYNLATTGQAEIQFDFDKNNVAIGLVTIHKDGNSVANKIS